MSRSSALRKEINPARALQLRASGLKWREIALALSKESGRGMPFHIESVKRAVRLDGKTHDDIPSVPDHVITPPARRAAGE